MKKKSLVIVESPTKAKTIGKILGKEFDVVSSMGHIIDLPQKKLGVDIKNGFEPQFTVLAGRQKILASLKKEAQGKASIYVATDPDREGEAIGWHLKDKLFKGKKVLRVVFHEITPAAVSAAFKKPRNFNHKMIEAQLGRRVLDRIVGYALSPLLWKKIGRGLSAGRVQSVALRLVVEREKEIQGFVSSEYWEIEAELSKSTENRAQRTESFLAKLEKIEEKKAEIKNKQEADKITEDLKNKIFKVQEVKKTDKKRYPSPPFITSTLQQEAFNKLKFNAAKTMLIAQQLYEGIDIGQKAPAGLITYMRTDSPRVSGGALKEVRDYISKKFGKGYLPQQPNTYKAKKIAQGAHEAIRPTSIARHPQELKGFLSPEQYRLYELIFNRFLASQMTPALYRQTSVDIKAEQYQFTACGSILVFDGFSAVYNLNNDDDEKKSIPPLNKDETLDLLKLLPSQHFTKPRPRYSDSSLVKALEEEGIGRPSTYAPIISTLILRDYIRRVKGYFHATELGFKVSELLVEYFPKVMDVKFTAELEEKLDQIEEGQIDRLKVLQEFYKPFKIRLDFAQEHIKKEVLVTGETCDRCGRPMIIKWGRKGKFLSCAGFPECKNSKSITTGVKCPLPGCGGELIERRSRRGFFYGCSNFPNCKFTSRDLPQDASRSA